MKQITLQGYAKVNLTLDVIGRREDGYHLLETVMQSVSLSDTVHLRTVDMPGIHLSCTNPNIPCDQTNTAWRAAELFLQHHPQNCGIVIGIEKRIPSEAGLAGGSADAAAVLTGLNVLLETGDCMETLCELGMQIGADIPFCIQGGTRLAHGIGEELLPLPALPSCCMVVCKPPVNVSTRLAYERIDQEPLLARPDTPAMLKAFQNADLSEISRLLCNVFESALALPEVAAIRAQMLQNGALGACMSGSGSAVFGIFPSSVQALDCLEGLKKEYPLTFLCLPVEKGVG